MKRVFIGLLIVLGTAFAARAQNGAQIGTLTPGQPITDAITVENPLDEWHFSVEVGDTLNLRMVGADGLAPMMILIDDDGNSLVASAEGDVDGEIALSYLVLTTGDVALLASRVGFEEGATLGTYTLTVERLAAPTPLDPRYGEVTFRCGNLEATAAAVIEFTPEAGDADAYTVTVYGIDGFQPAIRARVGDQRDEVCERGREPLTGDQFTLPGDTPTPIDPDAPELTARITLLNDFPGALQLTIGSMGGRGGRYLAIVTGLSLNTPNDTDLITLRAAPIAARDRSLLGYAIGVDPLNRLDVVVGIGGEDVPRCDDAGRRTCPDVPSAIGLGATFAASDPVIGDRFDAGQRFAEGDGLPHNLEISSYGRATAGAYAIVMLDDPAP